MRRKRTSAPRLHDWRADDCGRDATRGARRKPQRELDVRGSLRIFRCSGWSALCQRRWFMISVARLAGVLVLAGTVASCDSSVTPAGPTPSPTQTKAQAPGPAPAPAPAPEPAPPPSPPPPAPTYVYSGIVTDGQGRPVSDATVRGSSNTGTTDANGRYEFRSPYSPPLAGTVYPPAGYERKPVHTFDSFPLPQVANIVIRRITNVTISLPSTLKAGAGRFSFGVQVSFDTGQVENPHLDYLKTTSSDTTILKADSGNGVFPNPYVEGIAPGTASVVSIYFGASSAPKQIQVVAP